MRQYMILVVLLVLAISQGSSVAQPPNDGGLLIDWHPSGTMIVYSYYYSNEVVILDVNSNQIMNTFTTSNPLFDSPQWSPDGNLLTFLDTLNSIVVWSNAWDPGLANLEYYLDRLGRLDATRLAPISGFAWNPSGTEIAHSVGLSLYIWDLSADLYRQVPRNDHTSDIKALAWFDEDTLLVGDTSPAAILINASTGEFEAVFVVRGTIQIASVSAVSPSPDRTHIALASPFGEIEIWDPTQGDFSNVFGLISDTAVRSTVASLSDISSLVWSPTGDFLGMADQDGLIRVWEAETLELVQEYSGLPYGSIAWSPDGTQLAFSTAADGLVIVDGPPVASAPTPTPTATSTPTETLTSTPTFTPTPVALSPLRLTSMCSPDPASIRVWRVRNPNSVQALITWQVVGTQQASSLIVPASSDAFFETVTVPGPNTTRIFLNGVQQDVKASGTTQCP